MYLSVAEVFLARQLDKCTPVEFNFSQAQAIGKSCNVPTWQEKKLGKKNPHICQSNFRLVWSKTSTPLVTSLKTVVRLQFLPFLFKSNSASRRLQSVVPILLWLKSLHCSKWANWSGQSSDSSGSSRSARGRLAMCPEWVLRLACAARRRPVRALDGPHAEMHSSTCSLHTHGNKWCTFLTRYLG